MTSSATECPTVLSLGSATKLSGAATALTLSSRGRACDAGLGRSLVRECVDQAFEVACLVGEDAGVAEGVGEERGALDAGE
jgi:hypothetical protein